MYGNRSTVCLQNVSVIFLTFTNALSFNAGVFLASLKLLKLEQSLQLQKYRAEALSGFESIVWKLKGIYKLIECSLVSQNAETLVCVLVVFYFTEDTDE